MKLGLKEERMVKTTAKLEWQSAPEGINFTKPNLKFFEKDIFEALGF